MTSLAQYVVVLTGLQLADYSRLLASRCARATPWATATKNVKKPPGEKG